METPPRQTETPHDPPGTPREDEPQHDPAPADPEPEGVLPRPGAGTAADDVVEPRSQGGGAPAGRRYHGRGAVPPDPPAPAAPDPGPAGPGARDAAGSVGLR